MKFDVHVFFRKSVQKIQVSLKSDKNNGYFTLKTMYIYDNTSLSSCWNEIFETKFLAQIKTHLMFSSFSPNPVLFMR